MAVAVVGTLNHLRQQFPCRYHLSNTRPASASAMSGSTLPVAKTSRASSMTSSLYAGISSQSLARRGPPLPQELVGGGWLRSSWSSSCVLALDRTAYRALRLPRTEISCQCLSADPHRRASPGHRRPRAAMSFSRMLHGARTAALVAFSTTAISLVIGVLLGGVVRHSRRPHRPVSDVDQRPDSSHAGPAPGHT